MKYALIIMLSLISLQSTFGQVDTFTETDSLYREDQFYFAITYNLLGNMPSGMSQNGFSSGFHLGFIRDMPINANRNIAIGIGLGFSGNSYNQNLLISKDSQGTDNFEIIENSRFNKNKFSHHLIEIPIEFRWRTSTADSYKFWRIYSGIKMGYIFSSKSKFNGSPQNIELKNIDSFEKLQYGLTLSVGYNTWNVYVYYALNPIFKKDALLDGATIDIKAIKIGLIFYIL